MTEIPLDKDQIEALRRVLSYLRSEISALREEVRLKTDRLENLEYQYDALQRLHNDWLNAT